MANTLSVDQVSSVLRKVLSQSTGRTDLAQLDSQKLLTIGQKEVANAPDPILKSISQMVTKTIFSTRKYKAKFAALRRDDAEWGNMVRKLAILDKETDLKDNEAYNLQDGSAIDQYKVDNTKVLELKFAGQVTYTIQKTIFKDQLKTCFNSEQQFAQFMSMILTYVANKIEKIHEDTARATIAGLGASLVADKVANPDRVIHLLAEYNKLTGLSLTDSTVYAPENFDAFVKWAYGRIQNLSSLFTEYSTMYQTKLTAGVIDRHTPVDKQLAYFYAPFFQQARNRVLADTFHNDLLTLIPNAEMVNYWQSIKTPDTIDVEKAVYLGNDGAAKESVGEVKQAKVFGIICDIEAVGYSPIIDDVSVTPYNSSGKYWNYFWSFNERNMIDPTEKAVILVLD